MEKVKISKDGQSISFGQTETIPGSPQKFRQGDELQSFYRFIYENGLRRHALETIERICLIRKAAKAAKRKAARNH